MQRSRSKSKGACFQCRCKGHKKPDCRFYKQEHERKQENQKDASEKTHDVYKNKGKEREKSNIASGIIIEGILDTEDLLCAADFEFTDTTIINAFLAVQDSVTQTWIIDSDASFHCTPKECFLSFSAVRRL